MKTYRVVFHYSIDIEAEDKRDAEDNAYSYFTEKLISNGLSEKDFPAVVEEINRMVIE